MLGAGALGVIGVLFWRRSRQFSATREAQTHGGCTVTTDAAVGGEAGRADVEQERWSLNDQRDFLLRSIDDAERELLAGDLSKDDYDVLSCAIRRAWPRSKPNWPHSVRRRRPESNAVDAGAAGCRCRAPDRRCRRHRAGASARGAGSGSSSSCLSSSPGLVILVDHAVSPSLPGQPVSGSITESKVQLIEQQLAEADILNNNGEAVQALQLYDKVLSEDPTDPNALAASGWLEWNYGTDRQDQRRSASVGRQDEQKAIRLAPSYYAGHLFLGLIILTQDHNPTGAIAQFTKFLADNPPEAQVVSVASLVASGYDAGQCASPAGAGDGAGDREGVGTTTATTRQRRRRRRQLRSARRAATTSPKAEPNAAMSASVVDQPTETRSEWLASTPIASRTGDGSMLSDEQADPECTATPARSSPISTGSASTPCTPRQTRWGRRSLVGVAGPTMSTSSTDRGEARQRGDLRPGP